MEDPWYFLDFTSHAQMICNIFFIMLQWVCLVSDCLRPSKAFVFLGGYRESGILGTVITGATHTFRLFEVQPVLSSSFISSLMSIWYLSGMGYGLHAVGGPVVWMSISNRLGLLKSVMILK